MKNKRGITHVEIILSFAIFVGFFIFLMAIFRPFSTSSGGEIYLDVVEREIKKSVSADVYFQTIKINESITINDCFCLEYKLGNVIVKNEFETIITAETGENLCIKSTGKFFYVYSSKEFPDSDSNALYNSDCQNLLKDKNYVLGLIRSYSFYSNNKLNKLHFRTMQNYDDVKDELEIAKSEDFSFSLRDKETNEIILENTKNATKMRRVLARDVPIQLVYNDGGFDYAMLNIKVW